MSSVSQSMCKDYKRSSFWCLQIVRSVDLENAVILFFVACQFLAFSFFAKFHKESSCSCSLVAMSVSAGFSSAGKDYVNWVLSILECFFDGFGK